MNNSKNNLEAEGCRLWKACRMIDKTDWDGLFHEDDVDHATINWHKCMEIMSTCILQQSARRK